MSDQAGATLAVTLSKDQGHFTATHTTLTLRQGFLTSLTPGFPIAGLKHLDT